MRARKFHTHRNRRRSGPWRANNRVNGGMRKRETASSLVSTSRQVWPLTPCLRSACNVLLGSRARNLASADRASSTAAFFFSKLFKAPSWSVRSCGRTSNALLASKSPCLASQPASGPGTSPWSGSLFLCGLVPHGSWIVTHLHLQ